MKTVKTKKPNMFWLKNKQMLYTTLATINLLLGLNYLVVAQNNASYNANSVPISGGYNSAFGFEALKSNTGYYNTATGYNALRSNTTGQGNIATGVNALLQNTSGNWNVAFGHNALNANTTGGTNTAIGLEALAFNTTGSSNSATGSQALYSNTIGEQNTADGKQALHWNSTGKCNTASGYRALFFNTTGNYNTASGSSTLYFNTTGYYNTAIGGQALFSNTTGNFNVAHGVNTLFSNTTGSNNAALGYGADVVSGDLTNATAIGANAKVTTSNAIQLGDNAVTKVYAGTATNATLIAGTLQTSSGAINTANSLVLTIEVNNEKAGRIDANNAFYGYQSGNSLTTGNNNTAIGSKSLYSNASGGNNTASGVNALYSNTNGNNNTANGRAALYNTTTGQGNTASGESALYNSTTGSFNTASGVNALVNNVTGNNNTALGFAADVSTGSLTNATAIGYGAIVDSSNKIRLGNAMVEKVETQFKYTTVSDGRFKNKISQEDIKGLAFIKKLRPVAYNFDTRKFQEHITQNMPSALRKQCMNQDFSASTAVRRSGFIAQEVEKAAEEVGYDFDGVSKPQDASGNYSLAYSQFVVPLVKGMQEQEQKIEAQEKQNEQQQQTIQQLQQQIDELKKLVIGNVNITKDPATKQIETAGSENITLYPNPTTGICTITASNINNGVIEIYDMAGNSLQKTAFNNAKSGYQLNVSGYAKGIYLLNILANNKKYTKRLVIQ